ncbi:MAG: hypothetical protein ACNA7G_11725 [Methylobacter sp.]
MAEYSKHLSHAGQPGVGDMYFKYLHNHQHAENKVQTVNITPLGDISRGFDELPTNTLDPSDRKFLATAVVAHAIVVNATDSDWAEQNELLETLNIQLKQLCPEHSCKC